MALTSKNRIIRITTIFHIITNRNLYNSTQTLHYTYAHHDTKHTRKFPTKIQDIIAKYQIEIINLQGTLGTPKH